MNDPIAQLRERVLAAAEKMLKRNDSVGLLELV